MNTWPLMYKGKSDFCQLAKIFKSQINHYVLFIIFSSIGQGLDIMLLHRHLISIIKNACIVASNVKPFSASIKGAKLAAFLAPSKSP